MNNEICRMENTDILRQKFVHILKDGVPLIFCLFKALFNLLSC